MNAALQIAHWMAGLIVLAEALNKLERTAPLARGLSPHDRLVDGLKALAWAFLAIGAGGALAAPFLLSMGATNTPDILLRLERPTLAETSVLVGFATLIIRTRLKEG